MSGTDGGYRRAVQKLYAVSEILAAKDSLPSSQAVSELQRCRSASVTQRTAFSILPVASFSVVLQAGQTVLFLRGDAMKPILLYFKKLHIFAGAKLYINMLLALLISFFDSLGILLILPMLSVIGFANSSATELPIISEMMKPLSDLPSSASLPLVLGAYVLILSVTGLLQRHQSVVGVQIHQGFIRYLRLDTYRTIIESDWSFFS